MHPRKLLLAMGVAAVAALALASCTPPPPTDNGTDTTALRNAVTVAGVRSHLEAFQDIAHENGTNARQLTRAC